MFNANKNVIRKRVMEVIESRIRTAQEHYEKVVAEAEEELSDKMRELRLMTDNHIETATNDIVKDVFQVQ